MAFLSVFPLKTRILLPADYTFPFSEKAGLTKPGLLHIRMGHAAILNVPSLRSYRYTWSESRSTIETIFLFISVTISANS